MIIGVKEEDYNLFVDYVKSRNPDYLNTFSITNIYTCPNKLLEYELILRIVGLNINSDLMKLNLEFKENEITDDYFCEKNLEYIQLNIIVNKLTSLVMNQLTKMLCSELEPDTE